MMGYDNLINYFRTNFALMQHHKYNLSDLENMMPWERYIYIDLLSHLIKEEEDKIKQQKSLQRAQAMRR
jgi:3-methyladenine DNA glycosylase AlkD